MLIRKSVIPFANRPTEDSSRSMTTTLDSKLILCDAHVHIYDCFELNHFLDSAWLNFQSAASGHESGAPFSAVLLLSEATRDHWFLKLGEAARSKRSLNTQWRFRETDEVDSIRVHGDDDREILIVAGRQIVTAENLEVLALATASERSDGAAISETVEWVIEAGGIPVIPWGFGKWWGRRGKTLSQVLDRFRPDQLFLGDNGGRPALLGEPPQFASAKRENRKVLPGTDPLPFAPEAWRPGSVGFFYSDGLDSPTTAKGIRNRLREPGAGISGYMHCERLLPFLRNQLSMQWRKRTS